MKEETLQTIFVGVIFSFLLLFGGIFLFSPKEEFSEQENRYLQEFPELTWDDLVKGTYTEDLKNYVTDHFPFRHNFMNLKTTLQKLSGQTYIEGVYYGTGDTLLERYKKPENTDRLIEKLNRFVKDLKDVKFQFLLAPTGIGIYPEKLPSFVEPNSQKDTISYIYKNLSFQGIPVYETFLKKKDEVPLYYRLDHHWTTYGAYYAYVAYCEANGIKALPMDAFEIQEVSNTFQGTLYSKVLDDSLKPDKIHVFLKENLPITVEYVFEKKKTSSFYEPKYLKQKDKYSYFLDSNHPLIVITNENTTSQEELLVIKDSYANSIIPFLANHYKKIHVIDPRFYKTSIQSYIKEHSLKQVLFLYNVNTLDQDLGIYSIF